jgi:hypothetical protein
MDRIADETTSVCFESARRRLMTRPRKGSKRLSDAEIV